MEEALLKVLEQALQKVLRKVLRGPPRKVLRKVLWKMLREAPRKALGEVLVELLVVYWAPYCLWMASVALLAVVAARTGMPSGIVAGSVAVFVASAVVGEAFVESLDNCAGHLKLHASRPEAVVDLCLSPCRC